MCVLVLARTEFILSLLLRGAGRRDMWVWLGCYPKPSRSWWGDIVPGGRKGECAAEMAPFCSFFLEKQSSDHNQHGAELVSAVQMIQLGRFVHPCFLLFGLGEGGHQLWEHPPHCPLSREEPRSCWAVVASTILSWSWLPCRAGWGGEHLFVCHLFYALLLWVLFAVTVCNIASPIVFSLVNCYLNPSSLPFCPFLTWGDWGEEKQLFGFKPQQFAILYSHLADTH